MESFSKWVPKPKPVKKGKTESKASGDGDKKLKHASSDDSNDSEDME
jgi:hypothetical protein